MKFLIRILFFVFYSAAIQAQMPDTEIWLFKLKKLPDHKILLEDARNVSNRQGYDNQPSFSADGKFLFYTSYREDKQADIYRCKLKGAECIKLTTSAESEYSPQPLGNKNLLSTVVVEKDSSQKIHLVNSETGLSESVLPFDSVGYCLFVNADTVVYYKLTNPHSLRYYIGSSGEDRFICQSPIRSIKPINRHTFLFGIKDSSACVYYQYNFFLRKAVKIGSSTNLNEDVQWHPQWGLLMARDSRIMQYEVQSGTWLTLFDLAAFGIKKTGRFCFDPETKYLAIVEVK